MSFVRVLVKFLSRLMVSQLGNQQSRVNAVLASDVSSRLFLQALRAQCSRCFILVLTLAVFEKERERKRVLGVSGADVLCERIAVLKCAYFNTWHELFSLVEHPTMQDCC